jgi:hypothetical protein
MVTGQLWVDTLLRPSEPQHSKNPFFSAVMRFRCPLNSNSVPWWSAKFSTRIRAYNKTRGDLHPYDAPAILITRVKPVAYGWLFSCAKPKILGIGWKMTTKDIIQNVVNKLMFLLNTTNFYIT